MSAIGKYQSYNKGILNHPLEFNNSMVQLTMKLSKQQLELFANYLNLGGKGFSALAHVNNSEQLVEDSKEIYADMQSLTKATVENVIGTVNETIDIMDRLASEGNSKPRARVGRSTKRVKAESKQVA